jgi:hypothetical protein
VKVPYAHHNLQLADRLMTHNGTWVKGLEWPAPKHNPNGTPGTPDEVRPVREAVGVVVVMMVRMVVMTVMMGSFLCMMMRAMMMMMMMMMILIILMRAPLQVKYDLVVVRDRLVPKGQVGVARERQPHVELGELAYVQARLLNLERDLNHPLALGAGWKDRRLAWREGVLNAGEGRDRAKVGHEGDWGDGVAGLKCSKWSMPVVVMVMSMMRRRITHRPNKERLPISHNSLSFLILQAARAIGEALLELESTLTEHNTVVTPAFAAGATRSMGARWREFVTGAKTSHQLQASGCLL